METKGPKNKIFLKRKYLLNKITQLYLFTIVELNDERPSIDRFN